jgi:hypothetical protein
MAAAEIFAGLGAISGRLGPYVLPLGGALAFFNVYKELDPVRDEYQVLSWGMAIAVLICSAVFCSKLVFDWPKHPYFKPRKVAKKAK